MTTDAEYVARRAAGIVSELSEAARGSPPPRGLARLRRAVLRMGFALSRRVRSVLRDHWDVGCFDLAFGSLKAFFVYPALYFAGLAWAIPLAEYAPLNTQLWTAGYLFARGRIVSAVRRVRYGRPCEELDGLRGALTRGGGTRAVHRFALEGSAGRALRLRIERSRLRGWWRRIRGRDPGAGIVQQPELCEMVADPEFLFRAEPLRANPYLYERVLIEKLLATPEGRSRLLAVSVLDSSAPPKVIELFAEGPEPTRARVDADAERLRDVLRARLGSARSLLAQGLSWLHACHRRAIVRRLAELRDLEYRLLAHLAEGGNPGDSAESARILERRAALRDHLVTSTRLLASAARVGSERAALRLLRAGVREARARGLAARRARLILHLCGDGSPA